MISQLKNTHILFICGDLTFCSWVQKNETNLPSLKISINAGASPIKFPGFVKAAKYRLANKSLKGLIFGRDFKQPSTKSAKTETRSTACE